jgi:dTDP-glucose 4,6-dehydratase
MSEKIFVIGSNSFSGATFAAQALREGAVVLGASRSPEPVPSLLPYRWLAPEQQARFEFAQLDLNQDGAALLERIGDFRPDYVVNFAAQSMVAESWENPEHWYQTNVMANVRLHEGLRKMDFIRKYVHVTTPEVYGSTEGKIDETAPYNPSTPYAASRAACDLHLITFLRQYQFPVTFTRAANVYGPGQQLYRIIPRTILCIRTGEKLQLHGGGVSVRSFIHGRDIADGTLKVARQAPAGECYHFSTDRWLSIRDLVEMICERMQVVFEECVDVAPERPGKDAAYILDSTKARTRLGWADQVSLEDGITETIRWVDDNLDELRRQPQKYIHKP